jgi:hypothetical protein
MKLKWQYQKGTSSKSYRWYEAFVPAGRYTLEAEWSDVYEGRVSNYRVRFIPVGADAPQFVGKARLFKDAKALAQADAEEKE